MSQNIDDSPNSDNNIMDISEQTTISQESFGLSPETELKTNSTTASDSIGFMGSDATSKSIGSVNKITSTKTKTKTTTTTTTTVTERKMATINSSLSNATSRTSNRNYSNSDQHDNKFDDSSLDNRILVNKNTHTNSTKQRIGMTLVDMHPLMMVKSDEDDDLSPDSSTTFDGVCNPESEFANTESESPMHVSPTQRYGTLCLPKVKELSDKSYLSSGESEPDISQYQASVEPTFQSVSLMNYNGGKLATAPKVSGLRKILLTEELMSTKEDDSSVETISNNSFDDDIEDEDGLSFKETKSNRQPASNHEAVLTSVSATIANENGAKVQQMSGVAVTLPNGQTRDIDMKVIEPYKRCLSHGGYIKSPGHNAIVIFSACFLPDRSRADYHYVMENLFLYVIKTLDQFVTEDYILIYLHGGSNHTVPPLPWLKKCYHLLDRRIRKKLKNLYMVHPTFWLKSVVWMARPFISSKFWRKLVYIRTLDDLYQIIPVEKAAVPEKVKIYDRKHS
ncbi:caytaxin [Sitodiplosis mosellana]|uniref:caytaxin n=1 Tax=Sitodiplosis mosellana TaxID=263140 RepID=UPI00244379B5|nr:caytaxin [Sitodiplosis mosellana]XP_055321937.1 caytaxin [Sitodiplosis mosellana]